MKKKISPIWKHFFKNLLLGLSFILIALLMGILGYHFFEGMSWIDAFVNAAMILSGMGPSTPLHTFAGKLFAGIYALFSGLAFIVIIALILGPIIHQVFRKIHIESKKDST